MRKIWNNTWRYFAHLGLYGKALLKWLLVSSVTGLLCGLLGSAFHIGVDYATRFRLAHAWVIFMLPAAGLLVVAIYKLFRAEGQGTNNIISEVQQGKGLSLALLPAIFLSTVITHLAGGSAGREGAALQMGGTLGFSVGRLLRLDDRDLRTATLTGMSAFFSALFGTPLAATVFAMAVISVGLLYHAAFIPCLIASLVAYGISLLLGVAPTRFPVTAPALDWLMLLRIAILAALCAMVSVLFCAFLRYTEAKLKKIIKSPWLRACIGGGALLALTLLVGSKDYNGAGIPVITAAIVEGTARPEAFLLKILFTGLTLGAGFKGGEVVPSFFIGATFGCVVGSLLGIPAGFAAAIGLVSVFCGAVNCPIASIFLSVELFGADGLLYFALACGLSYVLSGYTGLYYSQRILYDKLKAQYIDVHANAYHEGEITEAERKFP